MGNMAGVDLTIETHKHSKTIKVYYILVLHDFKDCKTQLALDKQRNIKWALFLDTSGNETG